MDYLEFIKNKTHLTGNYGFSPIYLPDMLFDYQKYIVEWAVKKGRAAIFLDTGLGKTLIQLSIAQNILQKENKKVLILTPLAVAFQFVEEAKKLDIEVLHSKQGETGQITVANYERLDKFNPDDFAAVLLDESSILKNFDGAIRKKVTTFMKKVKYRFLSTATPSPNDFVELGTSSEVLGYLGYMDMLSKFFTNNEDTIKPQNIGTKWILKGHAKEDFFKWVSSWSISMRKPSDLGFSDKLYQLPNLNINYHPVSNDKELVVKEQFLIFNQIAKNLSEVNAENRSTIEKRCQKAVELSKDISVYWVNYNKEGDLIESLDPDSYQIKGSMNIDQKEDLLINFSKGNIKRLVTKAKMTAFGLNWQHCNHTIYFPTFSYERYYQAVRRFWRFGQTKDVTVDLVYSDGQKRVIDSLLAKTEKANELFHKLNKSINESYKDNKINYQNNLKLPEFLK